MYHRIIALLTILIICPNTQTKNSATQGFKAINNSSIHRKKSFAHDMAARFSTTFETIISYLISASKQSTTAIGTITSVEGTTAQNYISTTITPSIPVATGSLTYTGTIVINSSGDVTFSGSINTIVDTVVIKASGQINGISNPNITLEPNQAGPASVTIEGSLTLNGSADNYLSLSAPLTITGDATLNGGAARYLEITSNLTVNGDLTITNNNSSTVNIAAITLSSTISSENITFSNNTGRSGNFSQNGTSGIRINNSSTITCNTITFNNNTGGSGGLSAGLATNAASAVLNEGTISCDTLNATNNTGGSGNAAVNGGTGAHGFNNTGTINAQTLLFDNNLGGNGGAVGFSGGLPAGNAGSGIALSTAITGATTITYNNNRGGVGGSVSGVSPTSTRGNGGHGVLISTNINATNHIFSLNQGGTRGTTGGISTSGIDGDGVRVDNGITITGAIELTQNCTGGALQNFNNLGTAINGATIINTGTPLCTNNQIT